LSEIISIIFSPTSTKPQGMTATASNPVNVLRKVTAFPLWLLTTAEIMIMIIIIVIKYTVDSDYRSCPLRCCWTEPVGARSWIAHSDAVRVH